MSMLLELTFIGLLPLPQTYLYSDNNERGGETRVSLEEDSTGLRIAGRLKGIIGRMGGRVGFVGLRRPLSLLDQDKLLIKVEGIENLKARAVFKTIHTELPPFEGDLTFQTLLTKTQQKDIYEINLTSLEPTIRGRLIRERLPYPFQNRDVREFSFELKLSEQELDAGEGKDFNVKVYF
jgi:hypothetical protein